MTIERRVRFHRRLTAMLFFVACLCVVAGCRRTPPETALRSAVAQLQSAIESRDADAIDDALAEDFIGNDAMGRDAVRRLAVLSFMRSKDVGITLGPLEVTLQDRNATVRTTAALTGGSGRLMPDSAGLYDVRSGWRLDGNEWRMTSLEWTPR